MSGAARLLDAAGRELQVRRTPVPAVSDSAEMLDVIAQAARDPNVDVAKMSALLDLQQRLLARQAEAEFNQAFAEMARELPRIRKDGTVYYPKDKSKPHGPKEKAFNFARLEDMDELIRPLLNKYGFSLSFDTAPRVGDGGGLIVTGTLLHCGGHCRKASIPIPLDNSGGKNNLQGYGSSFSYGRRYTTTMLLNLVFEGQDDDGVAGGLAYIDEKSRQTITRLLNETNTELSAFLTYIEADSIDEIQVKDYPKAINALIAKKRKAAASSEQAP